MGCVSSRGVDAREGSTKTASKGSSTSSVGSHIGSGLKESLREVLGHQRSVTYSRKSRFHDCEIEEDECDENEEEEGNNAKRASRKSRAYSRKRRLSEVSLKLVLSDPIIRPVFVKFMKEIKMELILEALFDLNKIDNIQDRQALIAYAQKLYRNYFLNTKSNLFKMFLSSSTLNDVKIEFGADEDHRINETTPPAIIRKACKVLRLRVHNVVKYEFLPAFLTSEFFFQIVEKSEQQLGGQTLDHSESQSDHASGQEVSLDKDTSASAPASSSGEHTGPHKTKKIREESLDSLLQEEEGGDCLSPSLTAPPSTKALQNTHFSDRTLASDDTLLLVADTDELSHRELTLSEMQRNQETFEIGQTDVESLDEKQEKQIQEKKGLSVIQLVRDDEKSKYFYDFVLNGTKQYGKVQGTQVEGATEEATKSFILRRRSRSLLKQLPVVEVLLELENLMSPDTTPSAQLKRLNRILTRYGPHTQNIIDPPLETVQRLYTDHLEQSGTEQVKTLPDDLVDFINPVLNEVLERIDRTIVPCFEKSNYYTEMKRKTDFAQPDAKVEPRPITTTSTTSTDPILAALERFPLLSDNSTLIVDAGAEPSTTSNQVPLQALPPVPQPPAGDTVVNLQTLASFRDDINIGRKNFLHKAYLHKALTVDQILDNSFAVLQLKRYAQLKFQEEMVLFLIDVRNLVRFAKICNPEDAYDLVHHAQNICETYLTPGSAMEVNLSDHQRSETQRRFQECADYFVTLVQKRVAPMEPSPTMKRTRRTLSAAAKAADFSQPPTRKDSMLRNLTTKVMSLFDIAFSEILRMVREGLWPDFVNTALYEQCVRKIDPPEQRTTSSSFS